MVAPFKKVVDTEPHTKESSLFVSETKRICVGCPEGERVLDLYCFPKIDTEYSVLCRSCIKAERELLSTNIQERAVNVFEDLSTQLNRAAKRTSQAIPVDEIFGTIQKRIGRKRKRRDGTERPVTAAYEAIGDVYATVLSSAIQPEAPIKVLELAVKIGDSMVKNAIAAEKRTGSLPEEFNNLTADEQRDLLMEPARQLILKDAKFRKQLLNIKDVREALLGDAGIQIVEAEPHGQA